MMTNHEHACRALRPCLVRDVENFELLQKVTLRIFINVEMIHSVTEAETKIFDICFNASRFLLMFDLQNILVYSGLAQCSWTFLLFTYEGTYCIYSLS